MHSYKTRLTRIAVTLLAGVSLCALLMPAGLASASNPLVVEGSTTVKPIADASESEFEGMYPDTDLQVIGGGSSTGISKVLAGTIDIGMHSRDLKSSDGDIHKLDTYGIALDAVCVVVADTTAMSEIDSITLAQLIAIYEAESGITTMTWSDVDLLDGVNDGWPDEPVVPRARATTSGTRGTFLDLVPIADAKEQATITATGQDRLASNTVMAQTIQSNNFHIGYVGLGYADNPDYDLKKLAVDGVVPTEATVRDTTYPISRHLWMSMLKPEYDPTYKIRALDYINFIMSPAGQAYVESEGFITVQAEQPYWDINNDHVCNILDVSRVGLPGVWMTSGTAGWIPEDVDKNGTINILDISVLGTKWQWTW